MQRLRIALEFVNQAAAFHELQSKILAPVRLPHVENLNDVGVAQAGHGLGLVAEPCKVFRPGMGPGVGAAQTRPYYFHRDGDRFYFRFNTDVYHFIQNEFFHAPHPPFNLRHPTPWNAIPVANAAFEAYLRTTLPQRIPKIREYFKFKVVRLGPPGSD